MNRLRSVAKTKTLWALLASAALAPSTAAAATVAAGVGHTLVVRTTNGTVWAWGYGANGQLGNGTASRSVPTQTSTLTGVTAVAAGQYHSLALKSNGTVWAWGYNAYGELGNGNYTSQSTPVQVSGLTSVSAIASGDNHGIALKSDGTVWTWGYNGNGQLGDGSTTTRNTPAQVTGITATAIGGGGNHTLVVLSTGAMKTWGQNSTYQLGDGTATQATNPVSVSTVASTTSTAGGLNFSFARKSDRTAWAWGYNGYYQLGDGTSTTRTTAVQLTGVSGVSVIAAGNTHGVALKSDGTLAAWGYNYYGSVGDGTTTDRASPVAVSSLTGITGVAAGQYHNVAVASDGSVWTWGYNYYSQVGDGTTVTRTAPVKVADANFAWKVGTPTFSVAAGTYTNTQSVTLSCATAGATVRYTTNGTDPTGSSTAYSAPVSITATTTLKAKGFKTGLSASNTSTAIYTLKVATPTFNPVGGTYPSAQTVTISTTSPGVTLRYTTDGSDPTSSSTQYTAALSIGTTTTLKARGFRSGWTDSDVGTATYTMNFGTLAAPGMSPGTGTYTSSVTVTLNAPGGATIGYTTDGTDPTAGAAVYTAPLSVTTTTTLKAKAFQVDYTASATTTNTYTIVVATPTFTPDAGTYAAGQAITVATATAGATIRYTLTGTDPTTSDPVIASGGTLVAGNYTLKATASKAGCTTSAVKSATYTVTGNLTPGAASGGWGHTAVAQADGTVWAFGDNGWGALGDGSGVVIRTIPGPVNALMGVTALATGAYFAAARRSDSTVWTWGDNSYGQLGDNTSVAKGSPLQVAISGVTAIAAAEHHVVVAKSDGTVWAWGYNNHGQLGDGSQTNRWTPVQVAALTGVTRVAAGQYHSFALKSDGTVWAWGYNANGQLGDGSTTDRLLPVRVDGLSSITALAASVSAQFSLALRDDGTVWAWGSNTYSQLGDGTTVQRLTPVRVSGLSGVAAIRGGDYHGVALKADGTVWTWGTNSSGQIGDGTTTSRPTPVVVPGLTGISAVGAGSRHNLAIDASGSVWAWGLSGNGCLGDGTSAMRTSPTRIAENGFAWKVGTPTFSQLTSTYYADLTVTVSEATPGATIHYTTNGNEPTESDTVVASGGTVSITQSLTLKAKAWKAGMPASNTAAETYTLKAATPVASPGGWTYTSVQNVTLSTTTSGATIRYTTDGSEPATGSTAYTGAIPINATTTLKSAAFKSGWTPSDTLTGTYTLTLGTLAAPTFNPTPSTFVGSVSVTINGPGGATTRYTTDDSDPTAYSTVYVSALDLTATTTLKAKAFSASYSPSTTATATYTIKTPTPALSPGAGTYSIGQLVTASAASGVTVRYTVNGADPTANDGVFPANGVALVATSTIELRGFKTGCADSDVTGASYTVSGSLPGGGVTAGGSHSGARTGGGSAWTWGSNSSGQLGNGTTTMAREPVPVSSLASVTGLDAAQYHTVALKSDGTVWAWGSNANGQLGDGTTTQRLSPVQVSLSSASAIAGGSAHGVAAKSDGTAWAWGYNDYGQVGDGSTTQRLSPVPVSGLSGVTAVAAGWGHSLALKSDGTVWAWGYNYYGQVGDGSTTQRNSPVQVSGLTGVVAIDAGYYHSLALKSDGMVWAWGFNGYGQLGDGSTTQRETPVQVPNLTGARVIAAGYYHNLAAKTDGSAWAWGYNYYGQVGDGTWGGTRTSPVAVSGLVGVVSLAGGYNHTLAMDKDGAVWGWGYNWDGEVGDGTDITRLLPVKLSASSFAWNVATPTMSPASGSAYYAAVTVTLSCVTAGAAINYTTNGSDPTTSDPSVVSGGTVVVGASLTLKARAFKPGASPSNVASESYTLNVVTPSASVAPGTYATPQSVTLSTTTSGATIRYTTDGSAVTDTSTVYGSAIPVDGALYVRAKAWKTGWTASQETGFNYTMKVGAPALNPGAGAYGSAQVVTVSTTTPGALLHYTTTGLEPTESDPVVVSGATVAIDKSTTLRVRGWKAGGWTPSDTTVGSYTITLGTAATPTFSPVAGTYGAVQVVNLSSSTPGATIRYTLDGSDPTWTSRLYLAPITVDWTATVKAKAFRRDWTPSATATAAFTINLTNTVAPVDYSPPAGAFPTTQTVTLTTSTSGATIYYTTNGNDPTTSDPSVASGGTVTVDRGLSLKTRAVKGGMTSSSVRRADYAVTGAIASAAQHGFALKVDGTLWGWGVNGNGQIGNGTTTTVPSPVQVLSGIRGVSAVGDIYRGHSLAVKTDGTVWAWGENGSGQLGDGTTTQRLTPVQTSSLTGIVAVAAGSFHTLALTSGGQVYGWGSNGAGQVGDGTTTPRLTPVLVNALTDVIAIAAGYYHSLALKKDGTVWAWGYNYYGQLGDGTTTDRWAPVQATSLRGVTALAAGSLHSLALRTDGSATGEIWSWGANGVGQLGDGTTLDRIVPVRILSAANGLGAVSSQSLYVRTDAWIQGSIWGSGFHNGDTLTPGLPSSSTSPLRIGSGDYVAVAPGDNFSLALKRDTSTVLWGPASYPAANGLVLGFGTGTDDPDGDGLSTNVEWQLGTDPWKADTNSDGVRDGQAIASGKSATNPDMDGDGVLNAVEISQGTDPFNPDTDGDGYSDGVDCFPLDPTRWQCPAPTGGDTTPPVITLTEPTNASLISVVPPL